RRDRRRRRQPVRGRGRAAGRALPLRPLTDQAVLRQVPSRSRFRVLRAGDIPIDARSPGRPEWLPWRAEMEHAPHPPADETIPHGMWQRVVRDGEEDYVAVEEPLEIRVDGAPLAVTMRTPGHDEELALGFLYGEALIDGPREVGLTEDFAVNTIEVAGPLASDPGARRFYTTSSCGVCGKGALEEVAVHAEPAAPGPEIDRALLAALPDKLRQPTFERTGGRHA